LSLKKEKKQYALQGDGRQGKTEQGRVRRREMMETSHIC
jgi:hypothetical protein